MWSQSQHSQPVRGQRVKIASPMTSSQSPRGFRRGATAVEVLLVLAVVVCALLWVHDQFDLSAGVTAPSTSYTRGPAEDLAPLSALAVNSDQTEFACVGMDGTLRFHDSRTRRCIGEAKRLYGSSRSLSYSANGSRLLVPNSNGFVELWLLSEGNATSRTVDAHAGEVCFAAFAPHETCFLTCGGDQRCVMWDTETLKPLFELDHGNVTVRQACFNDCGDRLVTGDISGVVRVWDVVERKLIYKFRVSDPRNKHTASIVGLELLPGESRLLVATRSGELSAWDLVSGSPRRVFSNERRELAAMTVNQDGTQAIVGTLDGRVDIWNIATGECIRTIQAHTGSVNAVQYLQQQNVIVSAGWDGQLKFWEM